MNFKSSNSYKDFSHAKINTRRYHHNEVDNFFLEALLATSKDREKTLPKGVPFWRAQLGETLIDVPRPVYDDEGDEIGTATDSRRSHYSKERMKPCRESVTAGRANPKGIPYLYLSSKEETAITEIRPWMNSSISIGEFKINKDLHIINCTVLPSKNRTYKNYSKLPQEKRDELKVWADIEDAFCEPISQFDNVLHYIPTQCIAEFFKSKKFDGIAYKSSTKIGFNVVLFDLNVADLVACELKYVTSVKFKFESLDEPYGFTNYT